MGIENDIPVTPALAPRRIANRVGVIRIEVVTFSGLDYHGRETEAVLQITTADDQLYRTVKLERVW